MARSNLTLLTNVGATGNGSQRNVAFGGDYLVAAAGTFGGTSLTIQQLGPDNATWIDITDATLTAAGAFIVSLASGIPIRAVLTGGTPAGMYVTASLIG
jgi:hypothetical protein